MKNTLETELSRFNDILESTPPENKPTFLNDVAERKRKVEKRTNVRQQVDRSNRDKAEDVKLLDDKIDNKQVFESSCTGSSCTVSDKEENSPTEGLSSEIESDNGLFERESDSDVNS